jgi:hypothetical protein
MIAAAFVKAGGGFLASVADVAAVRGGTARRTGAQSRRPVGAGSRRRHVGPQKRIRRQCAGQHLRRSVAVGVQHPQSWKSCASETCRCQKAEPGTGDGLNRADRRGGAVCRFPPKCPRETGSGDGCRGAGVGCVAFVLRVATVKCREPLEGERLRSAIYPPRKAMYRSQDWDSFLQERYGFLVKPWLSLDVCHARL